MSTSSKPRDMSKLCHEVYYLPMLAVHKTTSTTTKLRIVFDASGRSSTGVLSNDQLPVGPTVHAPLIDVIAIPSAEGCLDDGHQQNVPSRSSP